MEFRTNCLLVFLLFQVIIETVDSCQNEVNSTGNGTEVEQNVRALSRRKRFLVFPEGCSLQLVFCCQTSALIPIGDIFLYGNTAALAWNLPTDPSFLTMFKKYEKTAQRRTDPVKHIYYIGENGEVLSKVPYKRKPIINPAFAKRSVDSQNRPKRPHIKIDKKRMHEKHLRREFLKIEHMDESSIRFHRSSRLGLFGKLEKLFKALGQDGRQCVLKKLCDAAQLSKQQQTFLQEILRAVFTLPKRKDVTEEEHKEYDRAHTADADCSTLYPGCDDDTELLNKL